MAATTKSIVTVCVILAAMAAGYLCRRTRLVPERAARWIMNAVAIVGYPAVGFLSIWGIRIRAADALLPALGAVQIALMVALGLVAARPVARDRAERGLFAVAGGVGNHGATMGGFVLYMLYGEAGLGRANIYCLLFMPMMVLLIYPTSRHFGDAPSRGSLGRLLLRSALDLRSIGLVTTVVAIWLSSAGVPRPPAVARWHVVDVLMFALTTAAYFAVGLRLYFGDLAAARGMIAALAGMRFVVGAGVGLGLAALTRLTPWAMAWGSLSWRVFVIQACVPTAVTVVAVANMFSLRPRRASVLFVTNTVLYLLVVLPVVALLLGA